MMGENMDQVRLERNVGGVNLSLRVLLPARTPISAQERTFLTRLWEAIEDGTHLCVQIANDSKIYELFGCLVLNLSQVAERRVILALSDNVKVDDVWKILKAMYEAMCSRWRWRSQIGFRNFWIYPVKENDNGMRLYATPNIVIGRRKDILGTKIFQLLGEDRLRDFTIFFDEGHNIHSEMNMLCGLEMGVNDLEILSQAIEELQGEEGLLGYWETFVPNFLPQFIDGDMAADRKLLDDFIFFLLGLFSVDGIIKEQPTHRNMQYFMEQYEINRDILVLQRLPRLLGWVIRNWKDPSTKDGIIRVARFGSTLGYRMESFQMFFDDENDILRFELWEPFYMDELRLKTRSLIIASRSGGLEVCNSIFLAGTGQVEYILRDVVRVFTPTVLAYSNRILDGRRLGKEEVVTAAYANLIVDICDSGVSGGILCLFPNLEAFKGCIAAWERHDVLKKIGRKRKVYMQQLGDATRTKRDRQLYQQKCNEGIDAIFLAVVREYDQYNFHGHYDSMIVYMGFPFCEEPSRSSRCQSLKWESSYQIDLKTALRFQVMRHATDCIGTHITGSFPVLVVLADFCYGKHVNQQNLPQWISRFMHGGPIIHDKYQFREALKDWMMTSGNRCLQHNIRHRQSVSHPGFQVFHFGTEK